MSLQVLWEIMSDHVTFQVAFLVEAFPTDSAAIWLFSSMYPHVHFQVVPVWEQLSADRTSIGF